MQDESEGTHGQNAEQEQHPLHGREGAGKEKSHTRRQANRDACYGLQDRISGEKPTEALAIKDNIK